ncbi:MAG: hypothetical protein F4Y12_03415 [Acidimicrobiaceae bacterium]|nr:hypothetical protein [Acidimicrobiaceae bacterium]MYH78179.1 hypothetical protein [Acidimicrobiaceae bacterium]MYK65332.1 hypothetical protein [Gemmatimonadota bacterium]
MLKVIHLPEGTGPSGEHSYRIEFEAQETGGYSFALTCVLDGVRAPFGLPRRIIADDELDAAIEDAKRAAARQVGGASHPDGPA